MFNLISPRNGLLIFVLYIFVSGCASFVSKDLPTYTYADLPPAVGEKTCLVIADDLQKEVRETTEETIAMLEKSGYFLKSPERCTPQSPGSVNSITFDFKNEHKAVNFVVGFISGFISGSTFTIFPAYGRDDFKLTVQFKMNGELIREYVYRDHINTWIHLSMLFIMSDHKPRDIIRQVYERMIMNFLYDYSREGQRQRWLAMDQ